MDDIALTISKQAVAIYTDVIKSITQIISGKLLSEEQIRKISSHVVGRHFAEFLSPTMDEKDTEKSVESARVHIAKASEIISNLQRSLEARSEQLNLIIAEVKEKKKLAERYSELAQIDQEKFAAFRAEMEEAIKEELVKQSEAGRRVRQTVSFFIWLITLVGGAALGAYFKEIVTIFQ